MSAASLDTTLLPLASVFFVTAALCLAMAVFAFLQRGVTGAVSFGSTCLAAALYAGGYAMEILSPGLAAKIGWNLVQYVGIPFLPAFWLLLALQYAGFERRITGSLRAAIFAVPILTFAYRFTDPWLHLVYASTALDASGAFPVLDIVRGPWYFVHGAYLTGALVAASALYLATILRSRSHVRAQAIVMLAASLAPWVSSYVQLSGRAPWRIDVGALGIGVGAFLALFGLTRLRFLRLMPLAHSLVFEATQEGIVVLDAAGRILDHNPAAARMLPELAKGAIGQAASLALAAYPELQRSLLDGAETRQEIRESGGVRHLQVRTAVLRGRIRIPVGHVLTLTDITVLHETMEELSRLATVDGLSGVFNRRAFFARSAAEMARARRHGRRLSALLLDLDHLARINEDYGYEAGDLAIRTCADICRSQLRSSDVIGRTDSGEFAVLLPETAEEAAAWTAERIRAAIATHESISEGQRFRFRVSIGVCEADPAGDEKPEALMGRLERTLERAKSNGRDRVARYGALGA